MGSDMISVLCFGNELHGDDAFGFSVANSLQASALDDAISVHFCGTNSQTVWPLIKDSSLLIIVDAVMQPDSPAGVLQWEVDQERYSERADLSHQGGVGELIRHLPIMYQEQTPPETHLLTCTVASITPCSLILSDPVTQSIPLACSMIHEQIRRFKGSMHVN